jgi:predicted transcriptional regulator
LLRRRGVSIRKVSIRQVKAARSLLAWSQGDLARESGISEPTVKRLESQDGELGGRADTAAKIITALESAGVIFVEENGEGAGVRLRKAPQAAEGLGK